MPSHAGSVTEFVLGGPDAPGRDRALEAEPVRARRAVPSPVQPGVIGQYLYAGPDDEHHEEHVQEVLRAEPPRKAGVHRRRGLCDPGVARHERFDSWELQQPLRQSDCKDEAGKREWQRP